MKISGKTLRANAADQSCLVNVRYVRTYFTNVFLSILLQINNFFWKIQKPPQNFVNQLFF